MTGSYHGRVVGGWARALGLMTLCGSIAASWSLPGRVAATEKPAASALARCPAGSRIARAVVLDAGQLRWWLDQASGAVPPAQKVIAPAASVGVYIRWDTGHSGDGFAVTLADQAGRVVGASNRLTTGGETEDGFPVPINQPGVLRPGVYQAVVTVDGCVARRIPWLLAFGRRPASWPPPPPPSKPASACDRTPRSLLACVDPAVVRIDAVLSSTTRADGSGTVTTSEGSGMVIAGDRTGTYVLTAAHVVAHARRGTITVTTAGGHVWRVRAVAAPGSSAPNQDVAVLLIGRAGAPAVERAGTATIRPGERVVAVGYHALRAAPPTAAAGQLVATGVDIGDSAGSAYLLHTAPLRPGDSGGPLYDQDSGRVIGMDVSLLSSSPGQQTHQANLSLPMPVVWTIAARLLARLHSHPGS